MTYAEPFGDRGAGHAKFSYAKVAKDASGCNAVAILARKKKVLRIQFKKPSSVIPPETDRRAVSWIDGKDNGSLQ